MVVQLLRGAEAVVDADDLRPAADVCRSAGGQVHGSIETMERYDATGDTGDALPVSDEARSRLAEHHDVFPATADREDALAEALVRCEDTRSVHAEAERLKQRRRRFNAADALEVHEARLVHEAGLNVQQRSHAGVGYKAKARRAFGLTVRQRISESGTAQVRRRTGSSSANVGDAGPVGDMGLCGDARFELAASATRARVAGDAQVCCQRKDADAADRRQFATVGKASDG